MGKRILMLLSNEYRPDPRVQKEALSLTAAGNQVTIICWDREHKYPDSRVEEGVEVLRMRTAPVINKSALMRQMPSFYLKCMSKARSLEFDAVHCHDLDTLTMGLLIGRLHGVPVVYDSHEHYSWMVADDVPGFLIPMLDRYEGCLAKRVDRIIGANGKISDYLAKHASMPPETVMNCVDRVEGLTASPDWNGPVRLFYGGSLEPLRYLIELCRMVKKNGKGVQLVIAGSGSLESGLKAEMEGAENIVFLGRLPKDRLMKEMSQSHFVVGFLDPRNRNNVIGTPNRMFEAMSLGIPVLASKGTYAGDIVLEEGCGLSVDLDKEDLLEMLRKVDKARWDDMSRRGVRAYDEKYNWSVMSARLVSLYDSL
jgi:glycosyltransferase involved in cell wall biosynthesis